MSRSACVMRVSSSASSRRSLFHHARNRCKKPVMRGPYQPRVAIPFAGTSTQALQRSFRICTGPTTIYIGGTMRRGRTLAALGVVFAVVAAAAVSAALMRSGTPSAAGASLRTEGGMPPALARHLERLQSLPGNAGEPSEGPGGAEEAKLEQLAYPDSDIPLSRLNAERAAAKAVKSRPFPSGKGRLGSWISVGPKNALYPFFGMRDLGLYVPNAYYAASRIDAMALAPNCQPGHCRMWIGPAGGGIWRTENALADEPSWKYLSGSFEINSIGAMTLHPNDPTGNTLWVGTGEGNTCGSGCVHGVGLYKSTDGGDTWSGPYGKSVFGGRGMGSIAVKPGNPNTIYASSTLGLHGMSSVCCSGISRIVVPGAKMWGLYKSTDGGATWTYIHGGSANASDCENADPAVVVTNATPCTPRGVRNVVLDPSNPNVVYASSYARGVWRSNDAGATWVQIKPSLNSSITTTLPWIAVTTLGNDNTRMYVSEGHTGSGGQFSRVFRSDDVRTGSPVWSDLTSDDPADTRWGTFNFCTGQCWYDNVVYTPAGHPDMVYVLGSYLYGESTANHRGVVLSTDAGQTWYDQTADGTDPVHPNALHPDQHAIVTNPNNPFQFFDKQMDVNFSNGATADWNWNSDPFFLIAGEGAEFYVPTIADPKVSKTLFLGAQYVWRTKTAGMGSMTLDEFRQHCNEWTGDFDPDVVCGDWQPLGGTRLTNAAFGDRAGGTVVAVERA